VLRQIVENAKKQWESEPDVVWIDDRVRPEELLKLEEEATSDPKFDRLNLRNGIWAQYKRGEAEIFVKSCEYGRVITLVRRGFEPFMPLRFWGRILQAFRLPPVRIFWFAAESARELPEIGAEVGPESVNGGYTFTCTTDAIVLYRAEEATRVLIHELLHAACTDNEYISLELREAKTETWAELFLVGLVSKGNLRLARKLWAIQAQWIQGLNEKLVRYHGVASLKDYSARYTLARIQELQALGIALPPFTGKEAPGGSARLTSPELERYMD
jgi:hypothetical protein